jgi:hypothetical protein
VKLGGKPVAKPTFNFEYDGTSGFLKLAETFENVGVGAYNGAAPGIKSKEVLAAAGSIVQVEAPHAAAIALLNGIAGESIVGGGTPFDSQALDRPVICARGFAAEGVRLASRGRRQANSPTHAGGMA